MKTILIVVIAHTIAISSAETPVNAPYPPSGWKPDGPAFELPSQTQIQGVSKFTVQENRGAYLPPLQKSQDQDFASPSNDYGAPYSFDLSVQGLPSKESEYTFRKSLLQSGADKPYVNTFTKELKLLEDEKRKQAEQQNSNLNTGEHYYLGSDKQTFGSEPQNSGSSYQPSPVSYVQKNNAFHNSQQFGNPQNQHQNFENSVPQNFYQDRYANAPVISKNQYDANLNVNQKTNFQFSQPQQVNDPQYYQQQQNPFQSYDAPQEQNFQTYQPQQQNTFKNYQTPQSQYTFQNDQAQTPDFQNYVSSQQPDFQNYKAPEQHNLQNTQNFQKTQANNLQNYQTQQQNNLQNYQTPQQNNLQNLQTSNQQPNFNYRVQPKANFQNQQSLDQHNTFRNTPNFGADNQQRGFLNQQEYGQPQEQQFSQKQASDNFPSGDQDEGFALQASFDSRRRPEVSVTGFSGNQESQNRFSEYGVPRAVQEYGPPNTRSTSPSSVDEANTTETNSLGDYDNSTDYNFGGPSVAVSTAVSDGRGRRGSARLRSRRRQASPSETSDK